MSRFSDTVRDEIGRAIPGVTVYVYDWDFPSDSTGALSDLIDDDGVTPLANPMSTDEFGEYYFNAAQGEKLIEFHYGGKLQYREQVILATDGSEPLGLIPSSTDRAGKYLAFDAAANAIASSGTGADAGLRTDIAASTGSSLVGFARSATGAVARTLQSKLQDAAHASDFGLVGDGSDETSKLTAFFNSAIANPGVPHYLAAKSYGFSAALPTIGVSDVWIEGYGAERHDGGTSLVTGTVLKWVGATSTGTTAVKIEPVSGASSQILSGIYFRYIAIDCNSGAIGTALSVKSVRESDIDVVAVNAFTQGVYLGVVATLAEAKDLNRNKIRVNGRQLEATTGYVLVLDGDSSGNVSMNDIEVDAEISNTPGVHCINSDNNYWAYVRITKNGAGTATVGMELLGGATATTCSRAENIAVFTGNMPLKAFGTDAYTVASKGNVIQRIDIDNNTPVPVLGTGAVVAVHNTYRSYTPTVASSTGAITTSSATGQYMRRDGSHVTFCADVTITTNGTGAGILRVGLPFTAASDGFAWAVSCVERSGTGKAMFACIQPGQGYVEIVDNNAYPGADGRSFAVSGTYRAA